MEVRTNTERKTVSVRFASKEVRIALIDGEFHVESHPSGNALIE